MNLNGAVNTQDPTEVYAHPSDSVNAQSTFELLKRILDNNTDKRFIYPISDNARYYKCRVLQEWLENHHRLSREI